ncbi:Barley B recombinant-like protein A [Hibiscus syriacus]|uniref:GAGA-binding transcriptional activator n=1 Tax=Hibiscus syriacus TaxID=106335 RepID=A0A6A3ARE0_HIBSY|nr:Barley B recombinant-like protein A [Hibiscus syriacus]
MTSMAERDSKPFIPRRDHDLMVTPGAAFHPRDCIASDAAIPMHYPPPPDPSTRDERMVGRVEEPPACNENVESKKRQGGAGPKTPKEKKPRKPKDNTNSTIQRVKLPKKSMDNKINGYDMDISGIPVPVCSCTGTAQQCYRWGCGGWQSACCTTNVSMYPLPMSTKRRGARIAGQKMSRVTREGRFKSAVVISGLHCRWPALAVYISMAICGDHR